MKPVDDDEMQDYAETAREGLKHMRAYMAYQGSDSRYYLKAKVAASAVSAYKGLRATEANRMAVELMAAKQVKQIGS